MVIGLVSLNVPLNLSAGFVVPGGDGMWLVDGFFFCKLFFFSRLDDEYGGNIVCGWVGGWLIGWLVVVFWGGFWEARRRQRRRVTALSERASDRRRYNIYICVCRRRRPDVTNAELA